MQTNQARDHAPTTSCVGLSRSGVILPCPNHPQNVRDSLYLPEPTENTQLWATLSPLTLPHLSLPMEMTINLSLTFSFALCLLTDPGASPCGSVGMAQPRLLGTASNKLSFQWQSSPELLVSPYLTNSKPYIIKLRLSHTEKWMTIRAIYWMQSGPIYSLCLSLRL